MLTAAAARLAFSRRRDSIPPTGILDIVAAGYVDDKEALLRRLARIEGQVRGVRGMVADEQYCIDVLTQIGAITRALDQVSLKLLSDHADHCVRDAVHRGGRGADVKVEEMLAAVERFARTR